MQFSQQSHQAVTKILRASLILWAASFCNTGNTAVINIIEDELSILTATFSHYGDNDASYYSGASLNQNIYQSALTDITNPDQGFIGSYWARTRYSGYSSIDRYHMEFIRFTEHPYEGPYDAGYNYLETDLRMIFRVTGNDGWIRFSGTHYGVSSDTFTSFSLLDLTTSDLYVGPNSVFDLINDHTYLLLYDSNVKTGADIEVSHYLTLNGTVVPEPSTLLLMATGIAGIGFASRRKKPT